MPLGRAVALRWEAVGSARVHSGVVVSRGGPVTLDQWTKVTAWCLEPPRGWDLGLQLGVPCGLETLTWTKKCHVQVPLFWVFFQMPTYVLTTFDSLSETLWIRCSQSPHLWLCSAFCHRPRARRECQGCQRGNYSLLRLTLKSHPHLFPLSPSSVTARGGVPLQLGIMGLRGLLWHRGVLQPRRAAAAG